ncbi:unnamed protein product [Urochloa humidicola]
MLLEHRRGCAPGASGHDRLSALPDEILGVILSLLPARQAVQMTVLSPRWRGLCVTDRLLKKEFRGWIWKILGKNRRN